MPLLPVDGARSDATRQSRSRLAIAAIVGLAGTGGALAGYLAASEVRNFAVCAASRSPVTVGLYVAIASGLAAWTLATRR